MESVQAVSISDHCHFTLPWLDLALESLIAQAAYDHTLMCTVTLTSFEI